MNADRERSLLSIPNYVRTTEAIEWADSLNLIWTATMGSPCADLTGDLEALKRWFNPVAQGKRLRQDLEKLAVLSVDSGPVRRWTLPIDDGRALVTPEGRCAIDLFVNLDHDTPAHVIRDTHLIQYDRLLARLYQRWSRHRINSVVDLLAGVDRPLQIKATASLLVLLVGGFTDEARPLVRLPEGSRQQAVDSALSRAMTAFANTIDPDNRAKQVSFGTGWGLYEANRRLGDAIRFQAIKGETPGAVWIRPDRVQAVIDRIAHDLARSRRSRVTVEEFTVALDALIEEMRAGITDLAGHGSAHERSSSTMEVRERLIQAVEAADN